MDDINKQSKRFYEIIDVIKTLHDKKRHDYGANEDIFANFRLSELSGIPLMDMAIYSLITMILFEEEEQQETKHDKHS